MRYSKSEKMEIIRLVDGSDLGVTDTLRELGINKSTFYNWYKSYQEKGIEGLSSVGRTQGAWNKIPQPVRNKVVETALEYTALSPRELAWHITDKQKYFISESSVYRILKERGLITTPAHIILSASDSFKDKTTRINQMWQTDFTYFKVIGWGWYYLSSVLDDYSRYIVAWELCEGMKAHDVAYTIDKAIANAGVNPKYMPRLLSDNGSCYISHELKNYLRAIGMEQVHGKPNHPQTQGKIERYHRSMKNVVKLENYYSPEELKKSIGEFIHYYNHKRYHEAINNLIRADVYCGKSEKILKQRLQIKQRTLQLRKRQNLKI
jgi:putative transposase